MQKWSNNRKERWDEEFKRKKEIKCKEIAFWKDSNEFVYLYKKSHLHKKNKKKYMQMIRLC